MAAPQGPTAQIVRPFDGTALPASDPVVRIHYAGHQAAPDAEVTGHLLVDGAFAGVVSGRLGGSSTDGTTLTAWVNTTGIAAGAHTLSAWIRTDLDPPTETPPIRFVLDVAPDLHTSASFDQDARELVVWTHVTDEDPFVTVDVQPPWAVWGYGRGSYTGERVWRFHAQLSEGEHTVRVVATDKHGQSTTRTVSFHVIDREAQFTLVRAEHEAGSHLRVEARVVDPDGHGDLRWVDVTTPLGSARLEHKGGDLWSARFPIQARLGTWNGTLGSSDPYGGLTTEKFTFTVDGERVVLFDRTVRTTIGGHVDVADLEIAGAGLVLEICVVGCSEGGQLADSTRAALDACDTSCETVRGDPGAAGVRPCRAIPHPSNVPAWALGYAVHTYDSRTLSRPPQAPRGSVPDATPLPVPQSAPRFCEDHAARSDQRAQNAGVMIALLDGTERHAFTQDAVWSLGDAPTGRGWKLWWSQSAEHVVRVRITGVPV